MQSLINKGILKDVKKILIQHTINMKNCLISVEKNLIKQNTI